LATVLVNLITCLALLLVLHQRLGGLPLRRWGRDTLMLLLAAVLAGGAAWGLASWVHWPAGLLGLLLQNGLSALLATGIYGVLGSWFGVAEIGQMIQGLQRRRA